MTISIGNKIYKLAKILFPINRSLTGPGNRETLKIIQSLNKNLKILEYRSGQKVFDWKIPSEWEVKEAYVKYNGKKIIDFNNNNLHLVGYSTPIKKYVDKKELFNHLHTHKKYKKTIPYLTSYYKKYWGFCISENEKKKIKGKKFFVNINTIFKRNGSLSIGEILIKGKSKKEVLLSANICHPSLANNELSGPTILAYLSKYLNKKKTNYSYRILFVPETIGPITYLSKKINIIKRNFVAGFTLSCIGDNGNFSIVETPNANSYSDKIAKQQINKYKKKNIYKFTESGSDERQFNYPSINLPVVTITRSKFGNYKEYHTSADNLNFISPKSLGQSYQFVKNIIDKIEDNYNKDYRIFATTKCEPFLSKRNLYRAISDTSKPLKSNELLLFHVLYYADGRRISDIKDILRVKEKDLDHIIDLLSKFRLIKKEN